MPVLDFLEAMKDITGVNGNLKKRRCDAPEERHTLEG
jgi:hypothetical protein